MEAKPAAVDLSEIIEVARERAEALKKIIEVLEDEQLDKYARIDTAKAIGRKALLLKSSI